LKEKVLIGEIEGHAEALALPVAGQLLYG